MPIPNAITQCTLFDIGISWSKEKKVAERGFSGYMTVIDLSVPKKEDEVVHALECCWGDTDHDTHSIYFTSEALDAAVPAGPGQYIVEGYTEEEFPQHVTPMLIRLYDFVPHVATP